MRASSFLLLAARSASAATVTFIVAPDTHFTTCGGVPDVEKNLRGVKEMNQLPGTPFPADSKWGGIVESNIRAVVVAGDIIDDGCNSNPANTTVDPGCAAQLGNYTDMFPIESGVQRPTAVRFDLTHAAPVPMPRPPSSPLKGCNLIGVSHPLHTRAYCPLPLAVGHGRQDLVRVQQVAAQALGHHDGARAAARALGDLATLFGLAPLAHY